MYYGYGHFFGKAIFNRSCIVIKGVEKMGENFAHDALDLNGMKGAYIDYFYHSPQFAC